MFYSCDRVAPNRFTQMVRGRGKFKPQRGGPRRFTSTRDPDAYVRHRPTSDSEEEDEETTTTTSGSDVENISGSEESSSGEEDFEVIVAQIYLIF